MMKEFNNMREKEKAEDDEYMFSPFAGMEKSTVLQEAKAAFNSPQEVKYEPEKCALLITKLIYLLVVGENFTENDITEVFFSVTKLFQSDNINLRRMTYLFLKEFAESTENDNIIIVISSLTKDINNSDIKLYRANAIRVLCKIIDTQMLNQIERYIKQAVVDKSPLIASSALVSAKQLLNPKEAHGRIDKQRRDIIKRWANEISEAANSGSEMVQFHALQVLKDLRTGDKLAISRMISQYSKTVRAPLGIVLLIRFTLSLLYEDINSLDPKMAFEFLCNCLRHKSDIVVYEAARALCRLPNLTPNDLLPALKVLNMFLISSTAALKFGAVRTLNDLANIHGAKAADVILSRSQEALEDLVTDTNRSIATLALTTLLKIGTESTIDKLIKQIGNFINDIDDEFKIVIVKAVQSLCLKYKSKTVSLLGFLATLLREEGGFEFKKVVVDSLIDLMEALPSTKESCLFHLAEFIEDCEFTKLSTKVLYYLGEQGPSCSNASKFVRYIYNRIILENAQVRAASVSALGKFGASRSELRQSVRNLLLQCLQDEDDEVRDRATFCLSLLERGDKAASDVLINEKSTFINPSTLLKQLEILESSRMEMLDAEFLSFSMLPHVEDFVPVEEKREDPLNVLPPVSINPPSEETPQPNIAEDIFKVKQFSAYGELRKSCAAVELTESETEYLVTVVKHIFEEHIVFQFNVTNTLNDQVLLDVGVAMEDAEGNLEWESDILISAPVIKYGDTGVCFLSFKLPVSPETIEATGSHFASFMNELKFKVYTTDESELEMLQEMLEEEVVELAEENGTTEEEYAIEDLQLKVSDFISRLGKPVTNFRNAWNELSQDTERIGKYELGQYSSLKDAVSGLKSELGLNACEGTGFVNETGENVEVHTMFLSGQFINGETILARSQFTYHHSENKTILKIAVRSGSPQVSGIVIGCL